MRICPEVPHFPWLRAVSVCQARGHSQAWRDSPALSPTPPPIPSHCAPFVSITQNLSGSLLWEAFLDH